MAIEKKTIRLLILEDSQNEAERLVSLFRNSGSATRVHRLTSSDDLNETLQHNWDLLICAPRSQSLAPSEAISVIRRLAKDIPIIQLLADNESDSVTEALSMGAQDAVPQGDDERLVLVAKRELSNLEERRARRNAEMALREAEKRCQSLLESSVDAITYVHDGMHIYANRAYLELFNYEDAEELEGMPVIDLIAGDDQAKFKDFLRNYQNSTGNTDLNFTGSTAHGKQFQARMSLAPAMYDSEPCTQVVIRMESNNAELEEKLREISTQDLVTGLFNRTYFLELLEAATSRAVTTGQPASVAYIRVDHYSNLIAKIGLSEIDLLLADLANLLRQHFPADAQLARVSEDAFAVLQPGTTPEDTRPLLLSLVKKVDLHLFDISGHSVQTTLSIGAAGFSEKTASVLEVVDRALHCAEELTEGNALRIFDPAQELAAAANRGNLVALVQQAIDNNGFRLLYQPIISLRGDTSEQYEVLLRLLNSKGEELLPAEFLEAANTAGLGTKLDRWVILNAVKHLTEHRSQGRDTRLFIHLTSASLQDPTLLPWLNVAFKAARLPSDALIFQLNEPDAITYLKQAKVLTQGLNELHCKIALNQFGCALNPFNALKHLHVDYVKLDSSYSQDLNTPENQQTLKEMLSSLHAQAKLTIVPCVETASMLTTLWQAGVNYIQGHYVQSPSPTMNYDFSSEDM